MVHGPSGIAMTTARSKSNQGAAKVNEATEKEGEKRREERRKERKEGRKEAEKGREEGGGEGGGRRRGKRRAVNPQEWSQGTPPVVNLCSD